MRCPRCNESDHDGPVCSCGQSMLVIDAARDNALIDAIDEDARVDDLDDYLPVPHSRMSRREAIQEARVLGDASEGDGWRRLVFRLATLLEGED